MLASEAYVLCVWVANDTIVGVVVVVLTSCVWLAVGTLIASVADITLVVVVAVSL